MIPAYRLTTGPDGHSHVEQGTIGEKSLIRAESLMFQETQAYASLDWHNAPTQQYVITLSGILEFKTHSGETFILRPGVILLALDTTGTGHTWRLIDDQPWRRAYVIYQPGIDPQFIPTANHSNPQ